MRSNASVAKMNRALRHLGDGGFMRDHHQDHVALGLNTCQQGHDLVGVFTVEVAGGLVRQQDFRVVGKAAGDGDALALAGGKLIGILLEAVLEPHLA